MFLRVMTQRQSEGCQGTRQEKERETHWRIRGASCDASVQGMLSALESGMQGQIKQSSQGRERHLSFSSCTLALDDDAELERVKSMSPAEATRREVLSTLHPVGFRKTNLYGFFFQHFVQTLEKR